MKSSNEHKPVLRRACGILVFDESNKRVLLSQRGPGARHQHYKWEVPGGEVESDETFEEGARREYKEELGVDVTLEKIIATHDEIIDSTGIKWEAKIFKGNINDIPSIQEPAKCMGYGWFTRGEVVALAQSGFLADYAEKDFASMGWL